MVFFINKKMKPMRKLFVISAITLFLGFNAQAEVKPYVSGKVNIDSIIYNVEESSVLDSEDSVFGGSTALGIAGDKTLPLRAEFEFNLMSEAEDNMLAYYIPSSQFVDVTVKAKINTYMLNFYYDFYNRSNFIPYIGFGIGLATAESTLAIEGLEESYKETAFAYQYGIGSYYKINNNLLVDIAFKINNIDLSDTGADVTDLVLSLGLRYNF